MTFKQWATSLIDSIVSGIALACLTAWVMPHSWGDFKTAFSQLWIVALGGAVLGFLNHIRQSPITRIIGITGVLFLGMILFLPMTACAIGPSVSKSTAAWDANTEADLAGYYLYWRTPTGAFSDTNRRPVGPNPTPTFSLTTLGLSPGTYVIAVSAYDLEGNESGMSNEVTWDAAYPGNPKNATVK